MTSDVIVVHQGDTDALTYTLRDAAGRIVRTPDGTTVVFAMKKRGGTLEVGGAAEVMNAAGAVRYLPQPTDYDLFGLYDAEWRVTFLDGTTETFPADRYLLVNVMANLVP